MKKDVAYYSARCMECQKVKVEHRHLAGLLQPLPIPEKKWEVITMDFIIVLPKKNKQHDSIMVVVDKLTRLLIFSFMKISAILAIVCVVFTGTK